MRVLNKFDNMENEHNVIVDSNWKCFGDIVFIGDNCVMIING